MSIFTTLLNATLLVAVSASANTTADDIAFNRTYKTGEKNSYSLHAASDAFKITVDAVILDQLLSIDKAGVPKVKLSTTKYSTTGETTPSEAPAAVESTLSKFNLPADIHMQGTTVIYLYYLAANIVPNAKVTAGSEIPISWSNSENSIGFKGSMKVTSIKTTEKLFEATTTLVMSAQGQEAADIQVSSVYNMENGALEHSTGTMTTRGIKVAFAFKVDRLKS